MSSILEPDKISSLIDKWSIFITYLSHNRVKQNLVFNYKTEISKK